MWMRQPIACIYGYVISMTVGGYSNQAWFQGLNDLGAVLLGVSADELIETKGHLSFTFCDVRMLIHVYNNRDKPQFDKVISNAIGTTYNFTCRVSRTLTMYFLSFTETRL